jgi:hypothetical protein
MLVTCHSVLRDRYSRRALILDALILVASAWLTAMAFVDPEIAKQLAFPGLSPVMTIGLIGTITFALAVLQLRVDWKARADRHHQAAALYAQSKLRLGELTACGASDEDRANALSSYRSLSEVCIPVPENQFNKLKKKHLVKVLVSTELSRHPGAFIWLICLRHYLVDSKRVLFKRRRE